MKLSRRGFVAGLAAATALPAGLYGYQKWKQAEQAELSSDEPATPVPALNNALLGNRLSGIWDVRFSEGQLLPAQDLKLLLDTGPNGKGIRGYLGTLPFDDQGFHLFGRLNSDKTPHLSLHLQNRQGEFMQCSLILDEVWGQWSAAGRASLSGKLHRSGLQPGASTETASFVAVRQPFVTSRERIKYVPELEQWLISPGHRLFHQLWHASRDRWHRLSHERIQNLRALGWQPGPLGRERHARGKERHRNGSGEDFLFMHRQMLGRARALQDLPSWPSLPAPKPFIGHGVQAFADYMSNLDGCSVPPAWESPDDESYNQWLYYIKSAEGYYADFMAWEAQYRDPEYLSTLCLGELGSRIELGIHDWLHMRWASLPHDPSTAYPMPYGRFSADFAERWFRAPNHFLGDPFSSHVDPLFWFFHGWIDDRIEDWFCAHGQVNPGEVKRKVVNDVAWFAPGRWVRVSEPWLGPDLVGCGAWGRENITAKGELDIETMKLALRIILEDEEEAERLNGRVPRRPWYGRHLTKGAEDY